MVDRILWIIGEKRKTFYEHFVQPPWSSGYKLKPNDNYFFVQEMKKRGKKFNMFELFATFHKPDFYSIVKTGNLEYFKFMCKKYKSQISSLDPDLLFRTNNIKLIKYAVKMKFELKGALYSAGLYTFEVLKYACDSDFKFSRSKICQSCVDHNNLKNLKYAIDDSVSELSIHAENDLEMIKFLHFSNLLDGDEVYPYYEPEFEIVKFLIDNGYKYPSSCIKDIKVAEFMLKNGIKFDEDMCECVADKRRYEVMKFMVDNGGLFKFAAICHAIANNNDLAELKFVVDNKYDLLPGNIGGNTMPDDICDNAIKHGNFEMLSYLVELGYSYTSSSLEIACYNNNPLMVEHLHKNGCELTSDLWVVCRDSKDRKYKEIRHILKKLKCP